MQHAFEFAPGLTTQFPKLRDVIAASVYGCRAGLKGVASDIDVSPSELSRMLNRDQDDPRKLDIEKLPDIIASTGDPRPVQWLIEKCLQSPEQQKAIATAQIARLLPGLLELAQQVGLTTAKGARHR